MLRCGLAVLAGCGRIGFELAGPGIGVDAPGDGGMGSEGPIDDAVDAMIDAPPGPMMTLTFGEAPITMIKNVTRDTFISNEAGEATLNYGGDIEVRIEADVGERALLGFNITSIPATATVVSATLTIVNTQIPPSPLPIELHRVLEQWDQGSLSGASGVANYTIRISAIPWLNPGAGTPLSSTATVGTFTPTLGSQTFPLPTSMVQTWVTGGTANNFGMVMVSTSTESTRFTTSEGTPASARPVLTVTFIP